MPVQFLLLLVLLERSRAHEATTEHLNDDDLRLDYENVVQLASLPLGCHTTQYPNKLRQGGNSLS